MDQQFTEVHHELKAIRRDMLDVVYQPEFDNLKDRVIELENAPALKKKAA
jgi:EAL domain-containing protein (putative c-di-GMP-specific phosphodiesterase class I)